jgi:hypothetical protein
VVNKEQSLKLLMLLSALESWALSTKNPLPDYLRDELYRLSGDLEKVVLGESK